MTAPAVLFAEMRPDPSWEDRFNEWYDSDHIPARLAIDGFEAAQRYRAVDDKNYLIIYDMTSLDVLKTPEYKVVRDEPSEETRWMLDNVTNFTRYLGTEIARNGRIDAESVTAPLIFAAMFNVPDADKAEFDGWMEEDHMPLLLQNKDWLGVRRFELSVSEPVPYNRLAVHYLASPDALKSPEREAARNTEWRARLLRHAWFGAGHAKAFTRFGPRF
jgi:hypothetical protein